MQWDNQIPRKKNTFFVCENAREYDFENWHNQSIIFATEK